MIEFSLRDECNLLLARIKSIIGSTNIVNNNIGLDLGDLYEGDGSFITNSIESLASFISVYIVNGIMSIELTKSAAMGKHISILVKLTGIGLPEKDKSSIYKSPEQIEQEFGAVAKSQPHKINFRIEQNKIVLDFVIKLKQVLTEDQSEFIFRSKKILLAEDNEVNVIVFSSFLDDWGTAYVLANNGKEALELLKTDDFDAVLMDIHMPVMDGIEAITQLRKFNKEIPVIVLSAASYQNDIDKAMAAGANEFLKKPVSSWELYSALAKFF